MCNKIELNREESCNDCVNCKWDYDCNEYQSWSWLYCEIYTEDERVPHSKVPAKCRRRGHFKRSLGG